MEQDEYPSWRKALFGQDTVANIRCAVKYAIWHTGYLLLTIVGAILLGAVAVGKGIGRMIPGERLGRGASRVGTALLAPIVYLVDAYQNSNTAKRLAELGAMVLLLGAFLLALGMLAYIVWLNPVFALQAAVAIAGGVIAVFAILEGLERIGGRAASAGARGINKAKSKAVETPGVRRVYGECPVHFDIEPKWFEGIDERLEKVMNE